MNIELEAYPFRHFVKDDFWDPALLRGVVSEFPERNDKRWKTYFNDMEGKLEGGSAMWGSHTNALLAEMEALAPVLSTLFDIPKLKMETVGGGYHNIPPGGKLGVHADFNRSPSSRLYRRLNMLVYLNEDWTEKDGGFLELWDSNECVKRVLPTFNRMVVFETSSTSFHGHPVPLPGPRSRKSIAAYFFSPQKPENYVEDHSTVWLEND
jgi:hypothetical protein